MLKRNSGLFLLNSSIIFLLLVIFNTAHAGWPWFPTGHPLGPDKIKVTQLENLAVKLLIQSGPTNLNEYKIGLKLVNYDGLLTNPPSLPTNIDLLSRHIVYEVSIMDQPGRSILLAMTAEGSFVIPLISLDNSSTGIVIISRKSNGDINNANILSWEPEGDWPSFWP